MADFRKRGIPVAVINEHLQGDLVNSTECMEPIFYWFYPSPCSHSKFGLEKINGIAKGIPFSVEELKIQSDKAAEALNVPIYGGDCVISADGTLRIIDLTTGPALPVAVRKREVKLQSAFINGLKANEIKRHEYRK